MSRELTLKLLAKCSVQKSCCDRSANCFFKPNCDIKRVTSAAVLVYDNVKNYLSRPDKEMNNNLDPVQVKTQVINAVVALHAV